MNKENIKEKKVRALGACKRTESRFIGTSPPQAKMKKKKQAFHTCFLKPLSKETLQSAFRINLLWKKSD